MNYKRWWERNGTRRPFPPLYEAAKAYGDGIYFPPPSYVKPGFCKWCGNPIPKGRKALDADPGCGEKITYTKEERYEAYNIAIHAIRKR